MFSHFVAQYGSGCASWDIMSPLASASASAENFWYTLFNLNTLWNILMLLGRNVEQDEMIFCMQDWQLWLSYFWELFPFVLFAIDFVSALLFEYPLEYFDGTWYKCRTG